MLLVVSLDKGPDRLSQIGQGMGFILTHQVDYFVEKRDGSIVVSGGFDHAERQTRTQAAVFLTECKQFRSAHSGLLPFAEIVFRVCQNIADIHDAPTMVNRGNQAVFVAAYVKDSELADMVSGANGRRRLAKLSNLPLLAATNQSTSGWRASG
jgi:hypothetical protein